MAGKGDRSRSVNKPLYDSNYDIAFKGDNWTESEFLTWLSDRLVRVYKESPESDFVQRLRGIAFVIDKTNIEKIKNVINS